jgi:hypothetical protein
MRASLPFAYRPTAGIAQRLYANGAGETGDDSNGGDEIDD